MPDENKEQYPIKIIVDFIYERDIKYMVAVFLVYVVLAVATFIYVVHNATKFDNKKWAWLLTIIMVCSIIVLA